ncbi:tetratricopeptide repeat protein [Qipengyuania xiapuensis]|uniref:Tetratricopeptide repeat protein n=1 Tax=Qipengyuania xiapuensis TaxID=2867236 RepID=A0ABX8ZX06_9SPHN|nr:tetratricopeptide repeat protein [Qipengyuania xiapuensis]QZD93540.1 tetratricopeptide repeat protein [Qipengyuania xiapuensis]
MKTPITLGIALAAPLALSGPMSSPTSAALSEAQLAALDPTLPGRNACRGFFTGAAALDRRLELARSFGASQLATSAIGLIGNTGKYDLPATGLTGEARSFFDQGIALTYGFNHKAAIRSFREAARLAPDCAMCWWGVALANGPNINAGMDDAANRDALAALERASKLAVDASETERAIIAAQKERYSLEGDRPALDARYADAMAALADANAGNDDLQILAAEAAMNTTPWNYWTEAKEAQPRIGKAVERIETVLARNPEHPQASHLLIHLLENGPDPKRAEAAADELNRSGPRALGHLVHMPAHIYYRIGRYGDSIEANIAAARADEAYLASAPEDALYRYGYYPHNVHFLLTSAQMVGNMQAVASETARLESILDADIARQLAWVQAIHAAPHFALAQTGSPQAILALTNEKSDLAYVEAMRLYARAVGYALAGDATSAEEVIGEIDAMIDAPDVQAMTEQGFPAPDIVKLAGLAARGRLALANGDPAAAVRYFELAESIEATIPYSEPPFWYYPVAQSRGAALYKMGRYEEAVAAFRKALFLAPNNGWALYGLSKAQAAAGNRMEARAASAKLDEIWQGETAWLSMDRL